MNAAISANTDTDASTRPALSSTGVGWVEHSRVVAMFAVVLLHAAVPAAAAQPVGSVGWWVATLCNTAARWCVPVFVMLSGALLLGRADAAESAAVFYRRRARRIVLPLVAWSILYLLWRLLKARLSGVPLDAAGVGLSLLRGTPYFHLWFLFMIGGLYAVTPALRLFCRHATRPELNVLVVLGFGLAMASQAGHAVWGAGAQFFWLLFLPFVPYYLCGPWLAACSSGPPPWRDAALVMLWAAVTACLAYGMGAKGGAAYLGDYLGITVVPMSFHAARGLRRWRPSVRWAAAFRRLAPLTFGIYLVHPMVLEVVWKLGLPPQSQASWVSVPATTVLVFALSACICAGMRRVPGLRQLV